MEQRLIDANALLENAQVYAIECGNEIGDDVREIKAVLASRIEEAPTIDPVKHGKWIYSRTQSELAVSKCSVCALEMFSISITVEKGHYCPNCGARMDEEPPKEDET